MKADSAAPTGEVVSVWADDGCALLGEARQLVAGGWCQKDMVVFWDDVDGKGCGTQSESTRTLYCSLGAIYAAASASLLDLGSPAAVGAITRLVAAAGAAGEDGGQKGSRARKLIRWNDSPGRTQAEVLAAFDGAIDGRPAAGP